MSQSNRNPRRSDCRRWQVDALAGRGVSLILVNACSSGITAPLSVRAPFGSAFWRQSAEAVIPPVGITVRPDFATCDPFSNGNCWSFGKAACMPFMTVDTELFPLAYIDLRKTFSAIAGTDLTTSDSTMESVFRVVVDEVPALTAYAVTHGGRLPWRRRSMTCRASRGMVPRSFGTQASALAIAGQARSRIPRPDLARISR